MGTEYGQPAWTVVRGIETSNGHIFEVSLGNLSGFGFVAGHDYSLNDRLNLVLESYLLIDVIAYDWPWTLFLDEHVSVRLQCRPLEGVLTYTVLEGRVAHQLGAAEYYFSASARGGLGFQF